MAEINLGKVVGDPGPAGPAGKAGSQWYFGTKITGINSIGTVFSGSGIDAANVNDKYFNTDTNNLYTCTLSGNAAVAKWAYIANLKGDPGKTGDMGPAGPTGTVDENTPVTFKEASTESDIVSGETLGTLFGKILKSIKTFRTAIGTLSSLKTTAKNNLVAAINELFASNSNLSQRLSEKAEVSHDHTISQITDIRGAAVKSAESVPWSGVTGKPETYPPETHTHDDRYYTETEADKKFSEKLTICSGQYATVDDFVQFVTKCPGMTSSGRFKDTGGWTPEENWWRFWAASQNPSGHSSSVDIEVLIASGNNLYLGYISGTSKFTAKWHKVFGPTDYYVLGSAGGVTCHVWASGPVVTVETDGGLTQDIGAWKTLRLGTLPVNLRPPMNLIFPVAGSLSQYGACIAVNNGGTVEIANRSNSTMTGDSREIFTVCTYAIYE